MFTGDNKARWRWDMGRGERCHRREVGEINTNDMLGERK
jgi:hypothetical protein